MRRLVLALATLSLAACIEESPLAHQGTPRSPRSASSQSAPQSSSSTPNEAPPPPVATTQAASPQGAQETARPAGAVFDGVLQVAGYRVDPPQASNGQTVTVTVFMRALGPITTDDMMFVHVDDSEGRPARVNGDHWPAGHKVPMPQWKAGEIIKDSFQVTLTGFADSTSATVWMGFWDPNRDVRMTLSNAQQVKNDGQNRFALAEIPITH